MSLSQESSAARNHDDRIEHAAQPIAEAMMALTRAVCLLGFSEGKEAVQRVHGLVCEAHEHVRQQHEL